MHPTEPAPLNVSGQVVAFKRSLAERRPQLREAFEDARTYVARAVDTIRAEVAAGRPVVPEIAFRDISDDRVSDATRDAVRATGCVVVRDVIPGTQATEWFRELGGRLLGPELDHTERWPIATEIASEEAT